MTCVLILLVALLTVSPANSEPARRELAGLSRVLVSVQATVPDNDTLEREVAEILQSGGMVALPIQRWNVQPMPTEPIPAAKLYLDLRGQWLFFELREPWGLVRDSSITLNLAGWSKSELLREKPNRNEVHAFGAKLARRFVRDWQGANEQREP